MKKNLIYVGVALAVVVAGVVVWSSLHRPNNENFPEGTLWVCTKPTCGTSFTLTMKQLGQHYKEHYGELPKCPKCGSESVRAEKCDNCGTVFPQSRGVQICPKCHKEKVAKPA